MDNGQAFQPFRRSGPPIRMKYLGMISALSVDELAATIVRWRHGRLSVTDGPFAETNEQIGGSPQCTRYARP